MQIYLNVNDDGLPAIPVVAIGKHLDHDQTTMMKDP